MDLLDVLKNVARKNGVCNCYIDSIRGGDGQGYMGTINMVDLYGTTKGGKEKQLRLVIKTATTSESMRQYGVDKVFEREIEMYQSVFPAFYNFEKERGVQKPLPCVAQCYYALAKVNPEILIMENLISKGYCIWNRKLQMDHYHIKAALKQFARLHAVSFAMHDQSLSKFKHLVENLHNIYDEYMEKTEILDSYIRKSRRNLEILEPNSETYNRYSMFLKGIKEKFKKLITVSDEYLVILHGDAWCNNMLFKYDKNQEPISVRFVDFQFSRLGSPMLDVAYFLYSSIDKSDLGDIEVYKNFYYKTLTDHIKLLGSDPSYVYPASAFDEHWRYYSIFGLITSGLLNFAKLSEKTEILDFVDLAESKGSIRTAFDYDILNINEYNDRMKHLIEHFVKRNLI